METTKYNQAEIEKIAHNYILSVAEGYLKIVKIIRFLETTNHMGSPLIEVRVKTLNKFGKEKTEKIYIHLNKEYPAVTGIDFKSKNPQELLDMDLLPNTEFEMSFEEANRIKNEKEAKSKHDDFVKEVSRDLRYNLRQFRKATAAKRSYVKYGVEKLESILPELSPEEQKYLLQIIDAINTENAPKQTIREYIQSLKGAKKELFEQIEKTFEKNQEAVYQNALKWFKSDDDNKDKKEEELVQMAKDYIENQKWNLFKAINRYLGDLNIVETKNILFRNTNNGFEGEWILTLEDGSTKNFRTHSIVAEGYIQRAHYRYLVNLK